MMTETIETMAARLKSALDGAERDALDASVREALRDLQRSIVASLERSREADALEEDEHHHDLLDRLRERTRKLEEEHPDLVTLVDRVARALSNAGI